MKKRTILITCLVILVIMSCIYGVITSPSGLMKQYKRSINWYKNHWPENEKIKDVGYIGTPEKAIEMAEKVLIEDTNEESMISLRPFYVEFDEKNKLWHVYNKPESYLGEVHIIFRQKDGKVLAFWVLV